jgi:HSP20 family protein
MSWENDDESDRDRWFRRRRSSPRDFFSFDFEEMDRMFEQMFREMAGGMPKDLFREEKLPDGTTVRKMGPFIHGYSMTIGPDGKPVVREFGNIKPSPRTPFSGPRPPIEYKDEREPLVDVVSEDGKIRIIAELPGVDKNDIKLQCSEKTLTISVDIAVHKFYKEVELPAPVNPKIGKATFRNGVLQVTLNRADAKKPAGEPIRVE